MNFTSTDTENLKQKGFTPAEVAEIVHRFTYELKPLKLERPCTIADGIIALSPANSHKYLEHFERERKSHTMIKFVPASGAASRMFKHLHNYSADNTSDLAEEFILNFHRFPFTKELEAAMAKGGDNMQTCVENNEWEKIFKYILTERGLHYDSQLKGLVIFHNYNGKGRTAFEEHMHEALQYAKQYDGKCRLHFTLSPSHIHLVQNFLNERAKDFPFEDFEISYSVQSAKSDTPALTKEDDFLRDHDNHIIFRPSGHGALITNLHELDADIIFIKNIDNVTSDAGREDTVFFKKVLAGMLMDLRSQAFGLLDTLERNEEHALENALEFIQHWFQPGLPIGGNQEQLKQYALLRLDRPMRVCGMVRNEGEPGGGPFWIQSSEGTISKQIVEKSQVDVLDAHQMKLLSESTHFNPVDLVCSIKDRTGKSYKLNNFVDHSTGFVSEKFQDGQVIKALEVPGLWNGAMALWNTVFIEVPVSTFHPVKTVNDLLRPGHQ